MGEPDESEEQPGLQVAQDLDLERREWRAERLGWMLFALVIVAAILGLFGRGLRTSVARESPDGALTVEYDRFGRRGLQNDVTVETASAGGDEVGLLVSERFLEEMRVEGVLPEPESTSVQGDDILYRFGVTEPGRPLKLRLSVTPETPWTHSGTLRLEGSEERVSISQFIYP